MRDLQDQRDSTRRSMAALDKIATRSGAKHLPRRLAQLALALMRAGGCAVEGEFDPLVALHMRSEARAHLDLDEEGADLRPEANDLVHDWQMLPLGFRLLLVRLPRVEELVAVLATDGLATTSIRKALPRVEGVEPVEDGEPKRPGHTLELGPAYQLRCIEWTMHTSISLSWNDAGSLVGTHDGVHGKAMLLLVHQVGLANDIEEAIIVAKEMSVRLSSLFDTYFCLIDRALHPVVCGG